MHFFVDEIFFFEHEIKNDYIKKQLNKLSCLLGKGVPC